MNHCLVTGGAGFIGSHLCEALLERGNRLTIVDNLSLGKKVFLSKIINHPKVAFIELDLLDAEALRKVFEGNRFEMVFHLAANSDIRKGVEDPQVDLLNTFQTTFHVLTCMKAFGVKKLFFASSSAVYGAHKGALSENDTPLMPISNYGAAKLAGEAFIRSFSVKEGIQAWIVRFPNVVGSRMTHGVIVDFIAKLKRNPEQLDVLGNGTQIKPYLYVQDLVEGVLFVCKHAGDAVNVFNLGVESRTSVREIAEMVAAEMKLSAKICYTDTNSGWVGDIPDFKYNLTHIHDLGWKASRTSNEAVRQAIRESLL